MANYFTGFCGGATQSGNANCIFVVIDYFTKYGHFLPIHHPITAASIAKVFMQQVYRLHGMPAAIVSDRDRVFTSTFWRELLRLADVLLRMSSAYHPQSDGQTERLNQTMETFLKCFVNACPSKWIHWISLAEYCYNSCPHSAIGRSPFEALYGYTPKHFGISAVDSVQMPELDDWVQNRQLMNELIKQHLSRAQLRMKKQADKKRSERQFQVGDKMFLKLQPYVQSTLAPRSSQKLAYKFFGPYEILSRVGLVAYKLRLPASSRIHPVFHVSQLKQMVPSTEVTSSVPDDLDILRVPEKVLGRRSVARGVSSVAQVLIQWSGMPSSLATWEDRESIQQSFPFAPAWGQAAFQRPGNASPVDPASEGPRRSSRPTRPSTRVNGPEWLV